MGLLDCKSLDRLFSFTPSCHKGGNGGRNQERSGEEQNGAMLSGGGLNPKRILKGREVLRTAGREGVCEGTPLSVFHLNAGFHSAGIPHGQPRVSGAAGPPG